MKTTSATPPDKIPTPAHWTWGGHVMLVLALALFAGCATTSSQKIAMIPILEAQREIPENQLLDVGILIFESEPVTAAEAEKQGTSAEIRKAEGYFMPYHLKDTLQRTSHWGTVRVLPASTENSELLISGKIIESNGEYLSVQIKAADAAGNLWLDKKYEMTANKTVYGDNHPGEKDPFQNLYNTISNDLVRFKEKLKPQDITTIRKTAQLKFAGEFAPAAFGEYLRTDDKGKSTIVRLPADNDPMMARVLNIREREYMFVDTLNARYEKFYTDMWPSYLNWRQLNLDERLAIAKIKREAMYRQLAGALLIAGAVALGATNSGNTGGLQVGMVIIGGQVLVEGFNVSKQAEIHSESIKELGESFGNEIKTVTIEFEGKQYELTGSAEEQFKKWRGLLQQIYATETGFELPQTGPKLNEPPVEVP